VARTHESTGPIGDIIEQGAFPLALSWNVAPTDPMSVVRFDPKAQQRSLDATRWGLVPFWGEGHQGQFRQHQHQGGRASRRSPPFASRSGSGVVWYRSTIFKTAAGKQPYAIALKSRRRTENWRSPAGIRSFAIITTQPNELSAELHNLMPAILAPEAWPAWFGEEPADEAQLKALLAPYPSNQLMSRRAAEKRRCRWSAARDTVRSLPGSGAFKPIPEAQIAQAVQLLDLILAPFTSSIRYSEVA
jgi:putative SOS response-associated peptidase YedK